MKITFFVFFFFFFGRAAKQSARGVLRTASRNQALGGAVGHYLEVVKREVVVLWVVCEMDEVERGSVERRYFGSRDGSGEAGRSKTAYAPQRYRSPAGHRQLAPHTAAARTDHILKTRRRACRRRL